MLYISIKTSSAFSWKPSRDPFIDIDKWVPVWRVYGMMCQLLGFYKWIVVRLAKNGPQSYQALHGLEIDMWCWEYPGHMYDWIWASQAALVVKSLPADARDVRDTVSTPGSGRSWTARKKPKQLPFKNSWWKQKCQHWTQLDSTGQESHRVRHDRATSRAHTHDCIQLSLWNEL